MFDLLFRDRRLLTTILMLIAVAGLSAYVSLPRLEDPELVPRRALVITRLEGATAARVESLVTKKIEDRLLDEIEEIKDLDSTSRAGISTITVELGDEIDNVEEVWSRIRDELRTARAELPATAAPPLLEDLEIRGHAIIAALTWRQDTPPNYAILIRLAEELEDQLRRVPGTEKVEVYGAPSEEITVEIDPARLAALGLSTADVSRQIRQTDSKVASGLLRDPGAGDLLLEVEGELDSLEHIRRTPIQHGEAGQFVRLGDLGTVGKDIRQPAADLAFVSGYPAVAVGVFVESEYRADIWARAGRGVVEEFGSKLPDGVGLQTIFDQTRYTETRLSELASNLLLGGLSVIVVLMVMMGWRSAILVGSALPLSALMVLAGMWMLGIPMHQMSITGLILALGLLIDNAIVMVDEVQTQLHAGNSAAKAIQHSVRHLAVPLTGSTLTTVLAFMPIALMPGSPGEFVGTIAWSVILSLISSLFLAMTVVPALTGLLHGVGRDDGRKWWQRGVRAAWLSETFGQLLDRMLRRPALGLLIPVMLPVAGFVAAAGLTEQFFPPAGRDMFYVDVKLPGSASVHQTEDVVHGVRQQLVAHGQVSDVHWFLGENAPPFYYNLIRDQDDASFYAQGIVQLTTADDVERLIRTMQDELDEAFPQARIVVRQLEQGPPFSAPIELRIYGPDLARLDEFGNEARRVLAATPRVIHADTQLSDSRPKLVVQVDEERTRRSGNDKSSLADQLNSTLEGVVGGSILEDSEDLPVRVRLASAGRSDLDRIASLELLPVAGARADGHTPLSAIGQVRLVPERSVITRRNGERVNTVQGYITAGTLPGDVLVDFRRRLDAAGFQLSEGYRSNYGGETEERSSAVGGLLGSAPVLVTLIVVTLIVSLRSFRMAGIIGVVGMMSLGLGLGSLWLFGYPFGFMAIVGSMGLVGVAINDAIVVLAALRSNQRAAGGDRQAVVEVVLQASRHVVSTTLTTIAGFMPLILAGGGFWPPLAIAIAGGVVGATGLALVFVPTAFHAIGRREAIDIARDNAPVEIPATLDRPQSRQPGVLATSG